MGKNTIPPEHAQELKKLFEEDARTVTRVLASCTLEWKPGIKENMESYFKTYKGVVLDEMTALKAQDDLTALQTVQQQVWQKGTSSAIAARGHLLSLQMGGASVAGVPQAATPSGAGGKTTTDARQVPSGMTEKLKEMFTSYKKTALIDTAALVTAGVGVGVNQGVEAVKEALSEEIDIDIQELLTEIAGTGAAEVAFEVAAAIPFIGAALGIAANMGFAAFHTFKAAMKQHSIHKVQGYSKIITPGNPKEAIEGLKVVLKRNRNDQLFRVGTEVAHGAARSVALAADVGAMGTTGGAVSSAIGTAAGLVKAAVNLGHAIQIAFQNFKEMYAGKRLLLSPGPMQMSELVNSCPLMCCYMLTEASPSALISFLSGGTLGPNWMDDVEKLLPGIRDLQRIANQCEQEAPYRLMGPKNGSPADGKLKSHSILSDRARDIPAQVMLDVHNKLKKNPSGLSFTLKMWFHRITTRTISGSGPL